MDKRFLRLALGIVMAAAGVPGAAQTANPVRLEGYVKLEKVVTDETGAPRRELLEPTTVVPGDRLIMGTRFVNGGGTVIENLVVSNPVPAAVRVAEMPDPAQIVSVDGGKTWGPFAAQVVRTSEGEPRAAEPADITHIRWAIPAVEPGGSGAVEFAVTVR